MDNPVFLKELAEEEEYAYNARVTSGCDILSLREAKDTLEGFFAVASVKEFDLNQSEITKGKASAGIILGRVNTDSSFKDMASSICFCLQCQRSREFLSFKSYLLLLLNFNNQTNEFDEYVDQFPEELRLARNQAMTYQFVLQALFDNIV